MVDLMVKYSVFSTEIGWSLLAGSEQSLSQLLIGYPNRDALLKSWLQQPGHHEYSEQADWHPRARQAVQSYAQGDVVDFGFIDCDLTKFTTFQQQVLNLVRKIPRGEVLTYGEVAHLVGRPKAARAVGGTMSKNPLPLIIPCHRVIGSSGQLTGFSAPRGLALKQELLEMEQVLHA